jgi:hypothetical protein
LRFFIIHVYYYKIFKMKIKRKRIRRFTLDQVVEAVNYWSMTTVPTEEVKNLLLKDNKDGNQLTLFNN